MTESWQVSAVQPHGGGAAGRFMRRDIANKWAFPEKLYNYSHMFFRLASRIIYYFNLKDDRGAFKHDDWEKICDAKWTRPEPALAAPATASGK